MKKARTLQLMDTLEANSSEKNSPEMPPVEHAYVEIERVNVGKRKRGLSESKVSELTVSILAVGLLNALIVTKSYLLIAGWHRLVACQRLGWKTVPVVIVEENQLVNELQEIDENLVRSPLNILQRAEHRRRGKEIFKRLSKEAPSSKRNHFAGFSSYTEFVASQSETTRRTIQQEISIAERLCDEAKDIISDHSFANRKVDLTRLSRMAHKDQVRIAKVIQASAETFDDALALLAPKGEPLGGHRRVKSPEAKGLEKLLEFASQGLTLDDFPDADEVEFIFNGYTDFTNHIARTLKSVLEHMGSANRTKPRQGRAMENQTGIAEAPLLRLIEATEKPA